MTGLFNPDDAITVINGATGAATEMTYGEWQAQAAAAKAAADAALLPIQKALAPGDHYLSYYPEYGDGLAVYGTVQPTDPEDGDLDPSYVFTRAYSVICPDGELGTVHRAECNPIADEYFALAEQHGWPDITTFTRLVVAADRAAQSR